MYTFLNTEFVAADKAMLHVSDLAIQRGYGIFDFLKVEDGHPYFIDQYLDRFYRSANVLRLEVPMEREQLKSVIAELIAKNNIPQSGIKMILTGGYAVDGYKPAHPNFFITQQPLTLPGDEIFQKGIKVITHDYVREIPEVKSINYLTGILVEKKRIENGAADVLYVKNDVISEFPRCNFFIVKNDGTIVTPEKNILKGITRNNVIAIAKRNYKVEEGEIRLSQLREAREAFLTSTTKRIVPVVDIDNHVVGDGQPGEISRLLLEGLKQLEHSDRTAAKQKSQR